MALVVSGWTLLFYSHYFSFAFFECALQVQPWMNEWMNIWSVSKNGPHWLYDHRILTVWEKNVSSLFQTTTRIRSFSRRDSAVLKTSAHHLRSVEQVYLKEVRRSTTTIWFPASSLELHRVCVQRLIFTENLVLSAIWPTSNDNALVNHIRSTTEQSCPTQSCHLLYTPPRPVQRGLIDSASDVLISPNLGQIAD